MSLETFFAQMPHPSIGMEIAILFRY